LIQAIFQEGLQSLLLLYRLEHLLAENGNFPRRFDAQLDFIPLHPQDGNHDMVPDIQAFFDPPGKYQHWRPPVLP